MGVEWSKTTGDVIPIWNDAGMEKKVATCYAFQSTWYAFQSTWYSLMPEQKGTSDILTVGNYQYISLYVSQ